MAIFTTWLTTGCVPWVRLTGDPELENLWVLGKFLGAPAFQNDVMYLIFADYELCTLRLVLKNPMEFSTAGQSRLDD